MLPDDFLWVFVVAAHQRKGPGMWMGEAPVYVMC